MPGLPQGDTRQRAGAPVVELPKNVDLDFIAAQLMRLIALGDDIVRATYDAAIVTNIKAMAMVGDALPVQTLTPGQPVKVFKNDQLDRPVGLYVRLQNSETGQNGIIYLSRDGSRIDSDTAAFAAVGGVAEATIVVPHGYEVWVDGVSSEPGIASPKLVGFTVPLNGKTTLFRGTRRR